MHDQIVADGVADGVADEVAHGDQTATDEVAHGDQTAADEVAHGDQRDRRSALATLRIKLIKNFGKG